MGSLYQVVSSPIGHPARFASEREMETFLADQPGLLAEHLASGDNEGEVLAVWRQVPLRHAFGDGADGRLDLLLLLRDGDSRSLYLAELKNEDAGKGAVEQLASYLLAWQHPDNRHLMDRVIARLMDSEGMDELGANACARTIHGVLVAPAFTAEGVNTLVARAAEQPDHPIQALKLFRFRHGGGHGHIVFVDDMYVVRQPGVRRSIRWTELHVAMPDLVHERSVFALRCGGRIFTATPDFEQGRGKNFILSPALAKESLSKLAQVPLLDPWEQRKVDRVAEALRNGESAPMSPLTLYLQRVFSREKEPDWQTPAGLWFLRDDPRERTILELDAVLK